MPMEAVDDLRESRPPMELMEHVDCRREPILEPGDGVSSIGTLLLALARLELFKKDWDFVRVRERVGGERLAQVDPRLSGPMLECLLMGSDPVEVSPGEEAEE